MSDRTHVAEIERVLDGGATGRDDLVSASWKRCVEIYGMDPARRDPARVVTESELRHHRRQSERLIAAARSGLQMLFRQVAGQNYVLLLTDAQGVCVDHFGDPRFEDELRGAGLHLGSDWAEERAGTCGVGACIVTGEPVTIHQSDHFGNRHTPLSCTAAPIYDSLGALSAVLDISLLRSPVPKSSQKLAMSLVTAAARRVEMANLMAESSRDWVLRLSASPEFLDVDPEAALRLDGSGRVIGLTRGARRFLPGEGPVLGRRIDEFLAISIDDLPDLMRDRPTEDRIVPLSDGGAVFGHAIAPRAPRSGRAAGARRHEGALAGLAGDDPAMGRLLDRAARLAGTEIPLLLQGETGTGKMRLARALHTAAGGGGLHLVEAAGAGPAALGRRAGAEGTLVLRRVEELAPAAQAALPEILDARPGLRVIATSSIDLAAACREGRFHAPLYFRLAGAVLDLPPLRRRRDLGWLLDRLMSRRAPDRVRLSPAARAELLGRRWPGNLRELERVLDVALALCEGAVIDAPDLPAEAGGERQEEESLETVLEACGWNMAAAARRLGVNRSTVLRRLRKAGLARPE